MAFVIRNKQNIGYFKVATKGWSVLPLCTKFPTEQLALLQKDALERSPKYFEKLQVLDEEQAPENVRY